MEITDARSRTWTLSEEEGYKAKHLVECQITGQCCMRLRFEDLADAEQMMFLLERAH